MAVKRVGNIPPILMDLFVGRPLVQSMVSSFRVRNQRARDELGWAPSFPTPGDALPSILAQLDARERGMASAR